ncbi:hypothetical protein GGR54DRAFT_639926 [Hypoxylon sp. NC1633]|nr:hypothetical protein GGR54DRAFT_639926 [Hypoxylon sp. NC1633]
MASSILVRLPAELLESVLIYLPNRDIKNLRLTCSFFRGAAHLRLTRVFLSPNPLNISVFRAIADHETLRGGVTEIIWDDAWFGSPIGSYVFDWSYPFDGFDDPFYEGLWHYEGLYEDSDYEFDYDQRPYTGVPHWFSYTCKKNIEEFWRRKGTDVDTQEYAARTQQVESQLPLEDSWSYYQALVEQETNVIATRADIHALRHGLQRFQSLKRITITAAAHGWLYNPLYETPMIRAFPKGFNYPVPRGWPCAQDGHPRPRARVWDGNGNNHNDLENQWRGFDVVTEELHWQEHQVSELLVDAHLLNTGLNCRVFDEGNTGDVESILMRLNLKRIDLDLLIVGGEVESWSSFPQHSISFTLDAATALEHVSFRTSVLSDYRSESITQPVRLRSIFPTDEWPKLKHLGLSGFLVKQADVLSLLASLPQTIRSVELSFLRFSNGAGSYGGLLVDIRDTLDWRDRAEYARPKVTIGVHLPHRSAGRAIWVDQEVYDFLYRDGENPFGFNGDSLNQVPQAKGIVRDSFDPTYERPWVGLDTYERMGYHDMGPNRVF